MLVFIYLLRSGIRQGLQAFGFVCQMCFFSYIQQIKFDLGQNEKLVQIILLKEISSKILS